MPGKALNPPGVAFELPDRCHRKVRVADRYMEASVFVPPGEPGDGRRQHIVADRGRLVFRCSSGGPGVGENNSSII
jgi:hypothetical protein